MSDNKSVNVKLKRVRLSFPSLFKARAFEEGQEPKFSASLIMDKKANAADIKALEAGIAAVLKENNKGTNKGVKGTCLTDGAKKADLDGYGDGVMFINANNARKIPVVDRDLTPLSEEDGKPYAGCYVNASVRLWWQDNKFGKRVNAQLRAIQFVGDGDPFGDKATDPNEVFEAVEGDEDAAPAKGGGDDSML